MEYILMHKNMQVASVCIDDVTSGITSIQETMHPEHLPVGVKTNDPHTLNAWWIGRSIPASRSGLRDALESLHITSTEQLLVKCFGLSLSDQYWVSPQNSDLQWKDINFFDNTFSGNVGNALLGKTDGNKHIDLMSPDNTSDGWLKKKWVIGDGKRWLMKGGSAPAYQEPLNEALASAIMRRLGNVPYADYHLIIEDGQPYSVCEDFITPETDLVSAWHISQTQAKENHLSPYQHYLICCEHLGIRGVQESLDHMLAIDFLIANTDRHTNNFGAIRNAETLEWIGPAPIFDCGTSMWHNQATHIIRPRDDQESKPFRSKHLEQIKLVSSLDWLDFSTLNGIEDEWDEILRQSPFIDEQRRTVLRNSLQIRMEQLQDIAMDLVHQHDIMPSSEPDLSMV